MTVRRTPDREADAAAYERIRERAAARNAAAARAGRDIAPIPPVADPDRRAACAGDFRRFCETYFPATFYLGWSADHLEAIARIEQAVTVGGLFALAMPRGEGKTSLAERAALWAVAYGYRHFVAIVGATEDKAKGIIETLKAEIETNDLLFADFPEICYPVRRLDGINNRAAGQLLDGRRTYIGWSADELTMATVPGSVSSGAVIRAVGITGSVRGLKHKAAGRDDRPDMVIVDDPQTRESAESPEQIAKRMRILEGDILGLAGPGKTIAGVMPCTVIAPGDVADQILDAEKYPEWNGKRTKLLPKFPDDMDLWKKYREISAESYRMHHDNRDALEFYRANREAMDAGAVASWPERFEPHQISGIQYAMDLYFKDEASFLAEYQNEPSPATAAADRIPEEAVEERVSETRKRGTVPAGAELTMFIDVQKNLLYYVIAAFGDDFTATIVDYGTYPEQRSRVFTLAKAAPTYFDAYPGAGLEGAVFQAVTDLAAAQLARDFPADDGTKTQIRACLVDSGWGRTTAKVYEACEASRFRRVLMPSKGVGITAAQRPISEYQRRPGDKIGLNWWIPAARNGRRVKIIEYDSNFWKSFVRERFLTARGDAGSVTIYAGSRTHHRQLVEHLTAEFSTPTAGRGRVVDIWKMFPGRENHWLDCFVGCCVAASRLGCKVAAAPPPKTRPRRAARRTAPPSVPAKTDPAKTGGRVFRAGRVIEVKGGDTL